MSTHKLFFAGSGGQGILLMGQILTYAAMYENKEVTFLPSYGPEMRGGTANCTVVISDTPVNCPLIFEADHLIAMNLPSLLKFESLVKAGGSIYLNSSLIRSEPERKDISVYKIPANDIATELGNVRAANVVALGAIVDKMGIVQRETVEAVLKKIFSGKKEKLFALNQKAFNSFKL